MGLCRQPWLASKSAQAFLLAVLVTGLSAQVSESRPQVGVPEDWTHHRIKFNSAILRQHPELAMREPRAAIQLYREAFKEARAAMDQSLPVSQAAGADGSHRDWSISLGSGRIQFGQYPAKWNTDPTAAPSCTTDYVIYGLNVSGVSGAGGHPSLVGLTNLYASAVGNPLCGGAQPIFRFSYNTNTTPAAAQGRILTSPVLSLDGTKVAFIETSTVAGQRTSVLHVLTVPTTGSQLLVTPVAAPPAGAMLNLTLGAASNTRSSPWVDYRSDVLYVGLDNGRLYKVTGVFKTTPTLISTAPWPINISSGSALTSPLLDSSTGNLFIGCGDGRFFYVNVNDPLGAVTTIHVGKPASLNPGIFDSPLFDATAGNVFAITSNDNVVTGATVVQINASTRAVVARVPIGEGSTAGTSVTLYDGDFDNAYFNNPATGHMLVCGTGTADTTPNTYLLGFSAGVLQPASPLMQISTNANARCGPITEYYNANTTGGPTDFFFWGVTRNCPGLGNAGCVISLANGAQVVSPAESGGTSGIVIDNSYVTKDGGSSIYFSQASANTAVKLTQKGLQ
jgi:hypothetical protein